MEGQVSSGADRGDASNNPPPQSHQEQDPFMIYLISECIFGKLAFDDLCYCRLVSTHWYEASHARWLKTAPVRCLKEAPYSGSHHQISDFLVTYHDPSRTYVDFEWDGIRNYPKFELWFPSPLQVVGYPGALPSRFLSRCGAWLTSLNLTSVYFKDMQLFSDVMSCKATPTLETLEVCLNYPIQVDEGREKEEHQRCLRVEPSSSSISSSKLKFLRVKFADGVFNRVRGCLPIDWLRRHTNLEHLGMLSGQFNNGILASLERMYREIARIRKGNSNKFVLKGLETDGIGMLPDNPYLQEFVKDSNLELECLTIDGIVGNHSAICDLMTFHSSTLKTLCLETCRRGFLGGIHPVVELQTPRLEHLRELRATGSLFQSLKFLKNFPNLQTLHLAYPSSLLYMGYQRSLLIAATRDEDMAKVELKLLTDFSYSGYGEVCSPEDFRRLKRWMPNLTKLEMELTNATFVLSSELWPSLENLHIVGDKVHVGAITGRITSGQVGEGVMLPNVTSFKNLRSFSVYTNRNIRMEPMWGFWLVESLLRIPSLESFSFGETKMNKKAVAKLRAMRQ